MNQFQPSTPRAALAASAVALTALVLGLSIVVPANLAGDQGLMEAASTGAVLPVVPLESVIVTERIAPDGAEDAVMRESSGDASARATRVVATSEAHPATAVRAHCPHAKAKAAQSHAT